MYDDYFDMYNLYDSRYNGDEYWAIGEEFDSDTVAQLEASNKIKFSKENKGCNCKKCGDHYPYAEPNQIDGSLICYSCKNF